MNKFSYFWRRGLWTLCSLLMLVLISFAILYVYLENELPDVETLKDVQLQVPLRIYTNDGKLIAEYGQKRRIPVKYEDIPQPLIDGILATEDQRFFEHPGVDLFGLGRAALQLVKTGKKAQGGSTITMQVARNFFLSRKKTYLRKFNEILLAIKIDKEFSKEKILELYLNKIYLGNRAYGVATAARVYYGKKLKDLTLAQMAMIAGLPQAPSTQNPLANPKAALKRRNHVLSRMLEEEKISKEAFMDAINAPITAKYHQKRVEVYAPYVAEMIRQTLYEHFGEDAYNKGYRVYSTIDSKLQLAANRAIEDNLLAYEQRHGYKGPIAHINLDEIDNQNKLEKLLTPYAIISDLIPSVIQSIDDESISVFTKTHEFLTLPKSNFEWAFKTTRNYHFKKFSPGDIIYLRHDVSWQLSQIPEVEGSLVSISAKTGAIQALVGGFNFQKSKYNRVIQAKRQPGSSFKPFVYAAAINKGFTLASIINDAPVVVDDPTQFESWRPQNHTKDFNGPTRLREGLVRSRNLVSIRVLELTGLDYSIHFLKNFGFDESSLPKSLSLALGSLTLTSLQITKAYSVIANGGFSVSPFLIKTIKGSKNQIILSAKPQIACLDCSLNDNEQKAEQVLNEDVSYLVDSALREVVQNGTGRGAKVLNRLDVAGKTGTTNDQYDAWFTGYAGGLVTSVWIGYDKPKTLNEYASKAALPIWVNYMKIALENRPISRLKQSNNLITLRIDNDTGLRTSKLENSRFETFRKENIPEWEPSAEEQVSSSTLDVQNKKDSELKDLF